MAEPLRILAACAIVLSLTGCVSNAAVPETERREPERSFPRDEWQLEPSAWHLIPSQSGSVNYYAVVDDPATRFIRARYRRGYPTAVLGYSFQSAELQGAHGLRWRWRVLKFPAGGQECKSGAGDSAASVYVSWKRGLHWYSLKYSWSPVAPKGTTCRTKRAMFVAQDTSVLESGGALNTWRDEEIDLHREFREHFADGVPDANVPDLAGVGLLTDGDQTGSDSEADYAGFVLVR